MNGVYHGRGKMIYADGRIFEGQFVDGQAVTESGVLRDANGIISSQGDIYGESKESESSNDLVTYLKNAFTFSGSFS